MANVLLIDESDVARKALKGILVRGGHRLAAVGKFDEAWEFLRAHVKLDLVIMELGPKTEPGMEFIKRLRRDCFLKLLPVAIYTSQVDRAAVRAAAELHVQNFLLKPYDDHHIYSEVAKALVNPWRQRFFEEEKSFCVLMGIQPDELRRTLGELRSGLEAAAPYLVDCAQNQSAVGAGSRLIKLTASAEEAGAWGAVECLGELQASLSENDWDRLSLQIPGLEFAATLIAIHLNPGHVPEPMLTDQEREAEREAREKALWFEAAAKGRCPVVTLADAQKRLDALGGCPVVDSAAAMFHMLADGHRSSLVPIMDRVEKDPGLAAQILISATRLRRQEDAEASPVEDVRLGVELLGELKLATLAKGLVTLEERLLHAPPFNWPRFWMFQIAVARMSRNVCEYLELNGIKSNAYTAGLLHDLGKLLVAHLYPFGWQAILAHSREFGVSTAEAERLFLGCTARELADHFALKHGLPDCFRHVMRSLETPDEAEDDHELVAVVGLARDLCRRNHVGHDGDQPHGHGPSLEDTRAWVVLAPRVFPSFRWDQFEEQMHASCQDIKKELHGWLEAPAV